MGRLGGEVAMDLDQRGLNMTPCLYLAHYNHHVPPLRAKHVRVSERLRTAEQHYAVLRKLQNAVSALYSMLDA